MHIDNIENISRDASSTTSSSAADPPGAAVAARLSEDPAVTVALVEAGPDDRDLPEVLQLDRWMELLESGYDWDYPIEPQENGNSFMRHARAKVHRRLLQPQLLHRLLGAARGPGRVGVQVRRHRLERRGRLAGCTSGWRPTRTPARTHRTTATPARCT